VASHASFFADDKGVVNVAKAISHQGSYNGIDPMGLLVNDSTNKDVGIF